VIYRYLLVSGCTHTARGAKADLLRHYSGSE
jgi:hypothetical protein